MVEEEGIIVNLVNGKAVVKAQRSGMCGGCSASKSCYMEGENIMMIEARNPVEAKVGQRVKIALASRSIMYASITIYLVPLVSLFVGALAGRWVALGLNYAVNQEIFEAAIGIIFLAVSFLILKAYNKNIEGNPDFIPVITEILDGSL